MRPRKTLVAALAVLGVTVLVFALSQSQLGQIFEYKTLDYGFRMRPPKPIDPRLLVIVIDDKSLEVAGRWPWPRDYHALLLQTMAEHKPRAIAFDILFSEPDNTSTNADEMFARSAEDLGRVVFAAVANTTPGKPSQLPIPILRNAGATGFINAERDADGALRRVPVTVEANGVAHRSFVVQTLAEAGEPETNHHIPVDSAGRLLINYRHRSQQFAESGNAVNYLTVLKSYSQQTEGKTPEWPLSQLEGRIILVGLSATGFDVAPTPIDDNMPLVFAQANAIDNFLQRDFLQRVPSAALWPFVALVNLVLAFFNSRNSALRSAAFSIAVVAAYAVAIWAAFRFASLWIELFWPVVGMGLVFTSVTAYQFFTEEREKRFVKRAFQQYLSPNVMAEVLANPKMLILGGVRRKMTVLFSDIRGFTTYAEKRPPEQVVPVLNELQDELTKVLLRHDGTLDKYMGDAIMAFWGAPGEPKPDDALRAVRAAHDMVETLKRLETKWRAQGVEPFGIGIGINTGEMIVGNMGSTARFNYTVIGDEVNLGARLESLTRQYDANIILSEATYTEVKEQVRAKELGEVTVKGRAKPVRIFALESKQNG